MTTSWSGRRVVVIGLGNSGFAAARALLRRGAVVLVTESSDGTDIAGRAAVLRAQGARVETGGHSAAALDAEIAVVSPGIRPGAPILTALRDRGIATIAEVELGAQLARCDLLAVTGTNGKTTTTSLLAAMLAESGIPSVAAGNIGLPLVEAIESVPERGAIAVEVSSFQLAGTTSLRPRIAVLLNVAEDHTDWHGSFDDYARAKARISALQGPEDALVFNALDERAAAIAAQARAERIPFSASEAPSDGAWVSDGELVWRGRPLVALTELPSRARGVVDDALAATAAALAYGAEEDAVVRALRSFRLLPHRLQTVAVVDGVAYIDDSKATNPHATLSAVQGLRDVVLIAGGRAKGIDLAPLAATVPPVVAVVALGEAAAEIAAVFDGVVPVTRAHSMREAVALARARSVPGGSVLLSPGCASLDMYADYAARGEDFTRAVRALTNERDGGHP